MFEESRDVTAAEKAFQGIFEAADKVLQKKMVAIFVGEVLRMYRHTWSEIGLKGLTQSALTAFLRIVLNDIHAGIGRDTSPQYQALHLGRALGGYLAVIENLARTIIVEKDAALILAENQKIANVLKSCGKKVKTAFIEKRIARIARQHAGTLSKGQQELIARMAAAFA